MSGSGTTTSSGFRSTSPKSPENEPNDSKRDSDSAAAGKGLASDRRQRIVGRLDVPQRLRAARWPPLHLPGAAEPENWLRWAGRALRGAGVRTAESASVFVVGRWTRRRYAGELPARAGW